MVSLSKSETIKLFYLWEELYPEYLKAKRKKLMAEFEASFTKPQEVKDFLLELKTLEFRKVNHYFDDSRGQIIYYKHLNPESCPNLKQYKVVPLWCLRHYNLIEEDYKMEIAEHFSNFEFNIN